KGPDPSRLRFPPPTPAQRVAAGDMLLRTGDHDAAINQLSKVLELFRQGQMPEQAYADASFLIGEAYFRESEWDKAIKEFETFISFYPRHQIADLVQYRLAMSYYDQMKPVEQDQALTQRALDQFKRLVKDYPQSRYATDGLAKIDKCRERIAQKEVWVANYYFTQGNPSAARQRLELVLKEYPRTGVIPETLFLLAEVNFYEGKNAEAVELLRRLSVDYDFTEWGRRGKQRLNSSGLAGTKR
ncbi:MAG: outer membrane protein assembly factor BamD, partial [Candidatus Rokuibacteriota bacterium]